MLLKTGYMACQTLYDLVDAHVDAHDNLARELREIRCAVRAPVHVHSYCCTVAIMMPRLDCKTTGATTLLAVFSRHHWCPVS